MASSVHIIDCTGSDSSHDENDSIIRGNLHDNKLYVCQGAGWECVTGGTSSGSVPLGRMLDIHIVDGGFKVDKVAKVCDTLVEVQEALLQLGEGPSKKRTIEALAKMVPRKRIKANAMQAEDMKNDASRVATRDRAQFVVDKLYAAKDIAFPNKESVSLLQLAYQLYM